MRKILLAILLIAFSIVKSYAACMSGIYTVGTGKTYSTIADAVSALSSKGICGPVIIKIYDGTYSGRITIGQISGTSTTSTIKFISASGDSSKVIITDTSSTAQRQIMLRSI